MKLLQRLRHIRGEKKEHFSSVPGYRLRGESKKKKKLLTWTLMPSGYIGATMGAVWRCVMFSPSYLFILGSWATVGILSILETPETVTWIGKYPTGQHQQRHRREILKFWVNSPL